MPKKSSKCPHCCGTGREMNVSQDGPILRAKRIKLHLKAGSIADDLGLSEDYIYMLESGSRKLTQKMKCRYEEALKKYG